MISAVVVVAAVSLLAEEPHVEDLLRLASAPRSVACTVCHPAGKCRECPLHRSGCCGYGEERCPIEGGKQ